MENSAQDLISQSPLVSLVFAGYRSSEAQKQLVKHQQHDLKCRLWDARAVLADAAL